MARIRTIKPEFWTSEDVAAMTIPTRLVFIFLWGFVDDAGIGLANDRLIGSSAFPMDDPCESLAIVRRALDELSNGGQIVLYEASGKRLLAVTGWHHQKIDRPTRSRYVAPTTEQIAAALTSSDVPAATVDPAPLPPLDEDSRGLDDDSSPYLGTKGSRYLGTEGARDARATSTPAPSAVPAVVDAELDGRHSSDPSTAATILSEYVEACRQRPPKKILSDLARDIATLLAEGFDPDDVRGGIRDMAAKGYGGGLSSFVNGYVNRPAPSTRSGRSTVDDNTQGWGNLTAQLAATGTDSAAPVLHAITGGAS